MSQSDSPFEFMELNQISPEKDLEKFLFTDNAPTLAILDMFLNQKLHHVVQRSNLEHDKEILVSLDMDRDPNCFFTHPISTILRIENPNDETEKKLRKISFEVVNSDDKNKLLEDVANYVRGLTKANSLINEVLNTADELYTNAIYNAPYVDYSNDKSGAERDLKNIKIVEDKRPHVFIGHDSDRIVLGCSDKFGMLNIRKLLERVKKCYENELSKVINYENGGAGIGAFMIFESSASVYIGVKQGIQTQICCSFAYKLSSVSRSQLPKNIHIYSG